MKFSLNARPFVGTTSTKHDLSFIMWNLANIQPGNAVYDPFVGTGSLLISASALGAVWYGSDISWNSMFPVNEKHKGRNIFSNFDFYSLERPEIFLYDFSKLNMKSKAFDVILCDPPFGIREHSKIYSGININSIVLTI